MSLSVMVGSPQLSRPLSGAGDGDSGTLLTAACQQPERLMRCPASAPTRQIEGFARTEDFWFIVAVRSEDEADIRAGEAAGGSGREGHPACNAPAVLGRGEKIRIVLEGLRGEASIAELCRREGIASSMYYGWSKEFLEAGKKRLAGDTARVATPDEVKDLRREASALKEVVADLTLENRLLKKSMIGDGGDAA